MRNDVEEALNTIINEFLLTLNVSIPCIVQAYENGRVTVTPAVKRVFEDGNSALMPEIPDVPIAYPSAAGYSMTFPIKQGDKGLLVFSHRDISRFKLNGEIEVPATYRKHSMEDAVFFPCNLTSTEHYEELKITDGDAEIILKNGRIDLNGRLYINGSPYNLHFHTPNDDGNGNTGPVGGLP